MIYIGDMCNIYNTLQLLNSKKHFDMIRLYVWLELISLALLTNQVLDLVEDCLTYLICRRF